MRSLYNLNLVKCTKAYGNIVHAIKRLIAAYTQGI